MDEKKKKEIYTYFQFSMEINLTYFYERMSSFEIFFSW